MNQCEICGAFVDESKCSFSRRPDIIVSREEVISKACQYINREIHKNKRCAILGNETVEKQPLDTSKDMVTQGLRTNQEYLEMARDILNNPNKYVDYV